MTCSCDSLRPDEIAVIAAIAAQIKQHRGRRGSIELRMEPGEPFRIATVYRQTVTMSGAKYAVLAEVK